MPELWIVDVRQPRLLVYREPEGPSYRVGQILVAGETASCSTLPSLRIGCDELFAGVG